MLFYMLPFILFLDLIAKGCVVLFGYRDCVWIVVLKFLLIFLNISDLFLVVEVVNL